MYSYEDRIRAVRLYIKLGRRVAATIHPRSEWELRARRCRKPSKRP